MNLKGRLHVPPGVRKMIPRNIGGIDPMEVIQQVHKKTLLSDPLVEVLSLSLVSFLYRIYKVQDLKESLAITTPKGIDSLETMMLGGVEQSILIRGQDVTKPLLLIVHGGPGMPLTPFHAVHAPLEEHYVVVYWDQRGAGRSYSPEIPAESMTRAQIVSDAVELVQYLCQRFEQPKLYLVGFSWGSVVGLKTASLIPERIEAFIGVGQVICMRESEKLSYEFALSKAKQVSHEQAIKELEEIGPPPYASHLGMLKERMWVNTFGGFIHPTEAQIDDLGFYQTAFNCPAYSIGDIANTFKGVEFSARALWPDLYQVDFFQEIPHLDVPVYFLEGRHDYVVPSSVTEKYFQQLDAPAGKQLVWFEHSAHWPLLEEPEKFQSFLIHLVSPCQVPPSTNTASTR